MKWLLKQHFQIESARRLTGLGTDHPCARVHGHSFKIVLTVIGDLEPNKGWVMDYDVIHRAFEPLKQELDHNYLNDVKGLENPTSEMIAKWIYEKLQVSLPSLHQVGVMETSTTECWYPVKE